jgi:hypothetical protein
MVESNKERRKHRSLEGLTRELGTKRGTFDADPPRGGSRGCPLWLQLDVIGVVRDLDLAARWQLSSHRPEPSVGEPSALGRIRCTMAKKEPSWLAVIRCSWQSIWLLAGTPNATGLPHPSPTTEAISMRPRHCHGGCETDVDRSLLSILASQPTSCKRNASSTCRSLGSGWIATTRALRHGRLRNISRKGQPFKEHGPHDNLRAKTGPLRQRKEAHGHSLHQNNQQSTVREQKQPV